MSLQTTARVRRLFAFLLLLFPIVVKAQNVNNNGWEIPADNVHEELDTVWIATGVDGRRVVADSMAVDRGCRMEVSADGSLLLTKDVGSVGRKANDKPKSWTARLFDVNGKRCLWTREFRSDEAASLTQYGILVRKGFTTLRMIGLDGATEKWKIKMSTPVYRNDSLDVLLGYRSATSGKLMGVSLSTGVTLWQDRKLPYRDNWGWRDWRMVGDTTLAVVADEVNLLNPRTGSLHVVEAKTAYTQTGKMLLKGLVIGAVGGLVGGATGSVPYYVYFPGSYENKMTHTCSGVVSHRGHYYVTDRNRLYCLTQAGDTVYTRQFPSRTMGTARILGSGDTVTVVNIATGLEEGRVVKACGRPFIASLDAGTGRLLSMHWLAGDKSALTGMAAFGKGVFMATDSLLAYRSLGDTAVVSKPWNVAAYGSITALPEGTLYAFRKLDDTLTPLHGDDDHCIVVTDKGKMLVVDGNLNITDDYLSDNYYTPIVYYGDIAVVGNGTEYKPEDCWIIHRDGTPIAHLAARVSGLALHGGRIFVSSGARVWVIPVGQFTSR